jgi:hypothetical protein
MFRMQETRESIKVSKSIYSWKQYYTVTRLVTVDGYWIVNWIYCTLQQIITTEYLNSTTTNSVGSILDDH